jgi:type I restriction enzyme S subunit
MRFSDFITLQRGFDLPKSEMREGPFPVLGSTSVIGHHSEFKVEPPGVITGRSGSLGVVQYVHERYWPHNTALWVKDFKGNDPKFVYFCMQGMDFARFNAGAGVPTLNRNHLDSLEVNVPPLPIQRHIAGILSAYDELIENSQRRIKILESMARALYREWFVHFRFPGHESAPLVPSTLGEIPQGWEVKKLSEIAENFDRLRKPLSKMQRADMQGAYPYYGAAKVFDHVNDFIFDGEYLLMAEDGSVITPERNPVLQLVNEKFWPNNHTHVLRGRAHFTTHFLYLGLSEVDILPYITGAAQPKITQENMNRIPFFSGPQSLHEVFNQRVEPIFRQSQLLQRQIQNLRRTRDLLLPRLLTGQIAVESLQGLSAVEQDSCLN